MDVLQRANQLESQGRAIYHCEVGQPASGAPKTVAAAAVSALNGTPDESRMGYTDAVSLWLSLSLVLVHLDVQNFTHRFPSVWFVRITTKDIRVLQNKVYHYRA